MVSYTVTEGDDAENDGVLQLTLELVAHEEVAQTTPPIIMEGVVLVGPKVVPRTVILTPPEKGIL